MTGRVFEPSDMLTRARAPRDPVTIYLDDEAVPAERGEPLAVSLLAADKVTLARSPKLHRPRGPSCLRGGCDGCLARVDGEPNVMTCLRPARGGERIETQNVIGSRRADLLSVTDWFFPKGIDHHHLMAGVPGVRDLMQSFARKLAGLGTLPNAGAAPRQATRREVDVLVVGGGLAGITASAHLAESGRAVMLVDDGLALGGSSLGARDELGSAHLAVGAVQVTSASAAVGVYRGGPEPGNREILVATPDGAVVVRARCLVFATGAHDGVLGIPNNDLPGVLSARALCRLASHGVVPDGRVVVVGSGFWADTAERLAGPTTVRVDPAHVRALKGSSRVRGVVVDDGYGGERIHKAGLVALAVRGAPSFELIAQAGGDVRHDDERGYIPARDAGGRVAPGVWAAGECAGLNFDPDAIRADAVAVAEDVARHVHSPHEVQHP